MTLSVRTTNNGLYAIKFTFASSEEKASLFTKLPGLLNETSNKSGVSRFKIKTAVWQDLQKEEIFCEVKEGYCGDFFIEQEHIISVLRALWLAYNNNSTDAEIEILEERFGPEVVVAVVNKVIEGMKNYTAKKETSYTIIVEL